MEDKYNGEERREHARLDVSFIVVCKINAPIEVNMLVGGREVHAIMSNLSEGGMALLANYDLPISTVVHAKFILVNDETEDEGKRIRSIQVAGEVRYNRMIQEKEFRLGIRFTHISDDDRRFIGEFIRMATRRIGIIGRIVYFFRNFFSRSDRGIS
ncbi:MAG: PilZ domain-containing protein [Candidatus Omnitrophica bacterium]|nr:PilZ domain-containing protein [Candidatus Omnitrophota bacterium]